MSIEKALGKLRAAQMCHQNAVQALIDEAIAALQQAEAQQADTSDLRIGVCITDGVLHAAVMQHESNGTITVVATAEIDAASLHGRDCIGRMKPAMLAAKDTK